MLNVNLNVIYKYSSIQDYDNDKEGIIKIEFGDEDYKGIYEDVFKDFEPTLGDILPFGSSFIPGTAEYQIKQQANAIRDQKLQNKLAYMGDILGIKIIGDRIEVRRYVFRIKI